METKVVTSKQFQINGRDFLQGLLVSVLGSVLTVILDIVNSGSLDFNWKKISIVAIGSGGGYIMKNFLGKDKVITIVGNDASLEVTKKEIKSVV